MSIVVCGANSVKQKFYLDPAYDRLPEDVRAKCVVLDDFWSPDLALGVYARSRCVFGIEMHSQVMALGRGVPACVFRHSGFGTKSGMLADLGVGDWCLDIDDDGAEEKAVAMVGRILSDPVAAAARCQELRRRLDVVYDFPKVRCTLEQSISRLEML